MDRALPDLRRPDAVDALRASWWVDEPPARRDAIDAANARARKLAAVGMPDQVNTHRRRVSGGYRISTRGTG